MHEMIDQTDRLIIRYAQHVSHKLQLHFPSIER